jgi:hypothetical protein
MAVVHMVMVEVIIRMECFQKKYKVMNSSNKIG